MERRVALITGGAGGIGGAIAERLAQAGRAVALADLQSEGAEGSAEQIKEGGGEAIGLALDVRSGDSVKAAFGRAREELGAVDILVNAAGWDELRPFAETDEQFWGKVIDINFTGTLRTTREALPAMMDRGFGRIVNISSDAGRVGSSLESVYAGAKGAVIAFTKTIAREAARTGVTANTVCPGPTRTPLLEGIAEASGSSEKVIEAMVRSVPMKRLGEPVDVAAAVAFLSSEEAAYITGQTLSVSGGLTMA